MYTDLPKITRCCFCIPLRYGILVWGYIKLLFFLFAAFVIIMRNVNTQNRLAYKAELIVDAVAGTAFLIDITITLIFIVGAHKKNPKLLRFYYRYTIFVVTLLFLMYLTGIGMDVLACVQSDAPCLLHMHEIIQMTVLCVGSLILNLYLLALIKNEILKLENNIQLSFTNDTTEPKCVIKTNESEPDNA